MCAFTGMFWKNTFFSRTEKEAVLQISAFSIKQFVKGFAATLPTAIYGIQSLKSTFSPGSDFCSGKTHKVSPEGHMHNITHERQSLKNSDSYY